MDGQGREDAEVEQESAGLRVNTDLTPEEEQEPKTIEQPRESQDRVPTKIVRAQKALESGRKIRNLEKSLSETMVYEPDQVATRPKSPNSNLLRMIAGLSLAVLLLGGAFVWNRNQAGTGATSIELDASPIVMPARPARVEPKKVTDEKQRPNLRPVRMVQGLTGGKKKSAKKIQKHKRPRSKNRNSTKVKAASSITNPPTGESQLKVSVPPTKKELPESSSPDESKDFGVLLIKGPPNPRIQIDQAKVGALPLPELGLPPGLHSVWAELKGHEVSLVQVNIVAGQSTTVTLKLEPIPKATFRE